MKKQDYHSSITVSVTSQQAFENIFRVSEWWAKKFEGKSEMPNDVFTVKFKNGDMYKMKVSEIVPYKKIVWDVIDSYQGWHDNHTEWTGTRIVWEVTSSKKGIEVKMTHVGLVPEFECFDACRQGWDYLIRKSLQKLIDENNGIPV